MDGVKPNGVERIAPGLSRSMVAHAARVRNASWPALYCRHRRNLADNQHYAFMGHVAGKILDTECSNWGWSRLHRLVLERSFAVPLDTRQLALRPTCERLAHDHFINLFIRSKHNNFLYKERDR